MPSSFYFHNFTSGIKFMAWRMIEAFRQHKIFLSQSFFLWKGENFPHNVTWVNKFETTEPYPTTSDSPKQVLNRWHYKTTQNTSTTKTEIKCSPKNTFYVLDEIRHKLALVETKALLHSLHRHKLFFSSSLLFFLSPHVELFTRLALCDDDEDFFSDISLAQHEKN